LSWLLIAGLGMIWAEFLLPFGYRRASPSSTVEEFERKMDLLAEANRAHAGRWVLVPRKGERFMGPRDRRRVRVRRRRRHVLAVLLDAAAITLLIGLFPPLRAMLVGTALLTGLLLLYVGLLVHLRAQDLRLAHLRARRAVQLARVSVEGLQASAANGHGSGYGAGAHVNGNGARGRVNGKANGNGHGANGHPAHVDRNGWANGEGNGHHPADALPHAEEGLLESGVRVVEDDVHVIVRRSTDLDPEALRSLAR
jgi:hypothetical protein